MSRLFISIALIIASLSSSCITAQMVSGGTAEGAITILPSTLITSGTTVSLKAQARVGNDGTCAITSYVWTFLSMPIYERDPPTFTNALAAETQLNFMTIVGDYKMQMMVTDCVGITTSFQFTVRVFDNIARIRASIDNFGQFLHNGNATDVNGFEEGQSLVMTIDNVEPGDIFAIVGNNRAQEGGTNPAAIAATITWRGMDFNTNNMTWKCVGTNLSITTGSDAWMKPGFADGALPTAVSMGLNTNDTIWYGVNGNKPVQASPDAHFIWYNYSMNNLGADTSQAWCRYVFSPPDYLVVGTTLVYTPGFFATTAPPTTAAPTTIINIPNDPNPSAPTFIVPGPTDPNTGTPVDGIPTNTPTTPITPAVGGGNKANTNSDSSSFPIIYIVIPIVVIAALAILAFIIYRRRRGSSLVRMRGSNSV